MRAATWEDVRRVLAQRAALAVSEPVTRRAAVAVILRQGPDGLELLFIRRAEHPDDPWSGQMAYPGGRAEPGDGSLRVTAVREAAEEIGLDLERDGEYLGPLDEVRAMARLRPMNLAIAPFVFALPGATPELRLNPEVRSVHWLPLDRMLGTQHRSMMDYAHQGTTLQFPCIAIDGLVIWGLTFRMFANLEAVLAPALAGDGKP